MSLYELKLYEMPLYELKLYEMLLSRKTEVYIFQVKILKIVTRRNKGNFTLNYNCPPWPRPPPHNIILF